MAANENPSWLYRIPASFIWLAVLVSFALAFSLGLTILRGRVFGIMYGTLVCMFALKSTNNVFKRGRIIALNVSYVALHLLLIFVLPLDEHIPHGAIAAAFLDYFAFYFVFERIARTL